MATTGAVDAQLTLALESQTRSLLSELDKRIHAIDSKWANRVGILETQVADSTRRLESFSRGIHEDLEARLVTADEAVDDRIRYLEASTISRVAALESSSQAVELWRPQIDASIDGLYANIQTIRADIAQIVTQQPSNSRSGGFGAAGILGTPRSVIGRSPATFDNTDCSRFGPGAAISHRDSGIGYNQPNFRCPVTGAWNNPSPPSFTFPTQYDHSGHVPLHRQLGGLPKLSFPKFDGTSPKLWQKRCEDYFAMYATEITVWVRVASMHFEGVAGRWFQSIEPQVSSWSWQQFCQAVHDRFGREQHELVIRKLFHIRQTSSVQDYVDHFCELIDVLVTYEHTTDPLYYTMKFIDGLRDDIKSVILVQRPSTLDTACALALLQEEADSSRRREHRGSEGTFPGRSYPKLPAPPPRWDKSLGGETVATKPVVPQPGSSTDKLASLRAYRRARGLCQYCAEKWDKGHKCAQTVQLHAIQEVWDLLNPELTGSEGDFEDSTDQFMMLLSREASSPKNCIFYVQTSRVYPRNSTADFVGLRKFSFLFECGSQLLSAGCRLPGSAPVS